jgi:saccharopine dehydrogenase-like NADP-dependent oxidoreductase
MEAINRKRIVILGSGMMVEPLIDFLLRREQNEIVIGTNMKEAADRLIEKKKGKISVVEIDVVKQTQSLNDLVKSADLVVSYVPPVLHEYVARACLTEKRNMITTSYVTEYLASLDSKVKDAGLIFMNEIGLDPGIDHLITHKVLNEAKNKGEKVVHYESWCGALCSPEYIDNPMLYKFSWAPRGALLALRNEAWQWINDAKQHVKSDDLLVNTTDKVFHPCFNLEGYYNRDSLTYKQLYGLNDATTVIRGTLRYKGFSFIFQCFKNLGFFKEEKFKESLLIATWREHFSNLIEESDIQVNIKAFETKYSHEFTQKKNLFIYTKDGSINKEEEKFYFKLSLLAMSKFHTNYIEYNGFHNLFSKIYASLNYLDLYSSHNKVLYYILLFYYLD